MPPQNQVVEWTYPSSKRYDDPFNEVTFDVDITDPDGHARTVPAFWRGENGWRARYSSARIVLHRHRTRCSDAGNGSLHGQEGTIEVTPCDGDNPLFRHGPLHVADSGRHLEHRDGTPFYWLCDTWWMGLGHRLPERYPWWRFERSPQWITHWGDHHFKSLPSYFRTFAAGSAGEVRIIFIPVRYLITVREIEPDAAYRAYCFDPRYGREHDAGPVIPDEQRAWRPSKPPLIQDWVLVLESVTVRR